MSNELADWFYVDGHQTQVGPLSFQDLMAARRNGSVAPFTLVWRSGLVEWTRFDQQFSDLVPPPVPTPGRASFSPPVDPARPTTSHSGKPHAENMPGAWRSEPRAGMTFRTTGSQAMSDGLHPWRRWLAKQVDVLILGLGGLFLFAFVAEAVAPGAVSYEALDNVVLSSLIVSFFWVLAETIVLPLVGTTPGRLVFGIRLRRIDGGKLTLLQAFGRSFLVFLVGMGGGIPFVALFTQYSAYSRLRDQGKTSWDESQGCEVIHSRWGPVRTIFAVMVSLAVLLLLAVLNSMNRTL